MYPAVLTISYGTIPANEVVTKILEANGVAKDECKPSDETAFGNLPTYLCNLKTKYYENTVRLVPLNEPLCDVPDSIQDATEALIIYFDADKKSFLNELPNACNWLVARNMELGILVTKSLAEDAKAGITRIELHKVCSAAKFIFNVIELNSANDSDESDDENAEESKKKHEYHEVLDSLRMNVWSNVECNARNNLSSTESDLVDSEESVESQLEAFENLLINIQNFQSISGSLTREQLLDEADKLVGMFCNTIGDDFADDDDDEAVDTNTTTSGADDGGTVIDN